MIFTSPAWLAYAKYADTPDFLVPEILLIDRLPEFVDEVTYLETLFQTAPAAKQSDWLGSLLSERPGQHIGAWFEIMLFGWLRTVGVIEVEPTLLGNQPDFLARVGGDEIAIEARAVLISEQERRKKTMDAEVINALHAIPRPYALEVNSLELHQRLPDVSEFQQAVIAWLDTDPSSSFRYEVPTFGRIELGMLFRKDDLLTVGLIGPTGSRWVNADLLKRPLRTQLPADLVDEPLTSSKAPTFLEDCTQATQAWHAHRTAHEARRTAK